MGGGGGSGPSTNDLRRLEELAKSKLREFRGDRRNVFISFANEDKPLVELLRGQAKNEDNALEFNDWSLREPIDSKRSDYIKQGIRERIAQASVTLVYVSENAASSAWVNWEIEESVRQRKKTVGVYRGNVPRRLPPAIEKHGIKLIEWSHAGIAKELK